jgi:hypothetical protein
VSENAVDDARIDPGFGEPFGGEASVLRTVVSGVVWSRSWNRPVSPQRSSSSPNRRASERITPSTETRWR